MTEYNYKEPDFKSFTAGDIIDRKLLNEPIIQHIASSTVDNDKLLLCRIRKQNGWPHEVMSFEKVNDGVLSDGTTEVKRWIVRNYFNGSKHKHKQPLSEEMTA